MTFKIGVYSRVSTEEQAKVIAGSIQCQVQRCNQFVSAKNQVYQQWGHIISDYCDEGYSAKDTKRPAYQALLQDVRNKKVNLVLISDLSRLSRNIADFSRFIEELQKHGASLLSIKEQFDSSTPLGEFSGGQRISDIGRKKPRSLLIKKKPRSYKKFSKNILSQEDATKLQFAFKDNILKSIFHLILYAGFCKMSHTLESRRLIKSINIVHQSN